MSLTNPTFTVFHSEEDDPASGLPDAPVVDADYIGHLPGLVSYHKTLLRRFKDGTI